jgi:hypothetical protein
MPPGIFYLKKASSGQVSIKKAQIRGKAHNTFLFERTTKALRESNKEKFQLSISLFLNSKISFSVPGRYIFKVSEINCPKYIVQELRQSQS